ncbi:hypothetical protein E2P81_ATG05744 [Venturia nashicola]|nr:hypothetical protein E2P81_ATG05744 [Venturia nashicola]
MDQSQKVDVCWRQEDGEQSTPQSLTAYVGFQWTALGPIEVSRSHLRQIIADHLVDINTNNILTLESAIIPKQQSSKIPKDWLIPPVEHLNLTNLPDMSSTLTHAILNETECIITSDHDATALMEKLKAGVRSAEKVTTAFVNCLNEIFFKEAIFRARHLDSERNAHPSKPFHLSGAFQFPSKTVSTLLISTLQQDWDVTSMN